VYYKFGERLCQRLGEKMQERLGERVVEMLGEGFVEFSAHMSGRGGPQIFLMNF
jgi:hypothetical protein